MINNYIHYFGVKSENNKLLFPKFNYNNKKSIELLGGKGAGLAEMSNLNLAVPIGFTVSTELCHYYYKYNSLPNDFADIILNALKVLEQDTGKIFGDVLNPLLLSARSGAAVSMPGMMDTILNLGINSKICEATDNVKQRWFMLDCYKRFLEMYGSVVLGIPSYLFNNTTGFQKGQYVVTARSYDQTDLSILEKTVEQYKKIIIRNSSQPFVENPLTQLVNAIEAVLKSWYNKRAVAYRKLHNIPDDMGTAVNIQSMVFGNYGQHSGTGVVFTRCPSTGENKLFGEFLLNAQGEDIVAGVKTPLPLTDHPESMQGNMPEIFRELQHTCAILEKHYADMQDIEFTVENSKLYFLQTRSGKRNAISAIKIAVDMVHEQMISKAEAIMRIEPESVNQLLHSRIDHSQNLTAIGKGLAASPGAATGLIVFSSHDAEILSVHHKVILVRNDTSPEDIKGMHSANGIITARGGMTSHAAVVTRGMGKPCICGVDEMIVDEISQTLKIGTTIIHYREEVTIDGSTGQIFLGEVPLLEPVFSNEFTAILSWADEIKSLKIRANAETPTDAIMALSLGAEGIGLCRTEHMFFDPEKILLFREMIVGVEVNHKVSVIKKLLALQIEDFKQLFRIMKGYPVNIRLLDPPLHEFLPTKEEDKVVLAESLGLPVYVVENRLAVLHEANPMLGHRGCRLGISSPEIYQMQITAIFEAIQALQVESIEVQLELMIPLISNVNELINIKSYIKEIASNYKSIKNYQLGTMIELPRAALQAGLLAKEVEFFDFGTNDLTQTTYGLSRDDVASFLPIYLAKNIFKEDPFVRLDEEGVGELIGIAVQRGKLVNPSLKLGACGEHAGNSESICFFHNIGLDYVSCSPYRIPIARIAAAQAKIKAISATETRVY